MADQDEQLIVAHFRNSCDTLERAANDHALRATLITIAGAITNSFQKGG